MDVEAQKALNSEYYSEQWIKQRNDLDNLTSFVYRTDTFEELLDKCQLNESKFKAGTSIYNYAIHRWLNLRAHDNCIDMLVDNGAVPCRKFDHDKDFTLHGVDFDLKLTRYPKTMKNELQGRPVVTRADKNKVIEWLYANQSQGSRKHLHNKLYIMVGDKVADRFNTELLKKKIKSFVEYYKDKAFNRITINDNGSDYMVTADLIFVGEI